MLEEKFIRGLLQFRKTVLAIIIGMTLVAGYFAQKVSFENSIEIWFLEDDSNLLTYRDFLERFEGDQRSIIGVFSESGIFTKENLKLISDLTEAAQNVPHASNVLSLTTIEVAQSINDGLEIAPLFQTLPETDEELEALKTKVMNNPMLYGNLISTDGKATAIFVNLENGASDFASKVEMTDALEKLRDNITNADVSLLLSGLPVIDAWLYRFSRDDSKTLTPLSILLIMVATLLVFRRFSAMVMPIVVVAFALVWAFGLMGILGLKLNIISATLTAIILAVGIADSIHVLADFYHEKEKGLNNYDATISSISSLLVPCFFTSATTIAGMLSLSVSQLKPIGEFGWLAGFGVFSAFFLSITIGPILLVYLEGPDNPESQSQSRITPFLLNLVRSTKSKAVGIVGMALLFLVIAGWGYSQLRVGANPIGYFKPSSEVRQSVERIDGELGGASEIGILVKAQEEGFKDPEFLKRLDEVMEWVESIPGLTIRVLSPTDGLREIDRVLNGVPPTTEDSKAGPSKGQLPTTRAQAAQFYLLLEGDEDFENTIQDDYSVGRLVARGLFSEAHLFSEWLPKIEARFAKDFPEEDIEIKVTGYGRLITDMEVYLLDSQIKSFLLAFVVVTLMLGFLLRSPLLALFSMIPNFIPIFLGLGFMGLVGISLDPGTVMIGAIAMGLVVDDTVHFLVRLRRHTDAGKSLEDAIENATIDAGRPIVITSIVLAAAFSIMVFGNFTPNINFGIISALIILLALIADLVLLPAVLRIIRPKL